MLEHLSHEAAGAVRSTRINRLSSAIAHQSNVMLRELFQTHFVESNAGLFEHAASSSAALPLLGIDKAVAIAIESSERL